MRALLRKDYPWLLTFAVAGVVVPSIVLFANAGFRRTWIIPDKSEPLPGLLLSYWICAFCLAWLAAVRERWTGTEDYLRHRPVSFRQSFVTRVLFCFAVMALWITIPITLHEMLATRSPAQAALADIGLSWRYVAAGTMAFGVFGGALFGFSVRASEWTKLITASVIGFGLVVLGYTLALSPAGAHEADPWLFAGVQLVAAFVFTGLAIRQQVWGQDLDRPLPAGLTAFTAAAVGGGFMTIAAYSASWSQDGLIGAYEYPSVIAGDEGLTLASGKGMPWKDQALTRQVWWDDRNSALRRWGLGFYSDLAGSTDHVAATGRGDIYLRRRDGLLIEVPTRFHRSASEVREPFGKPPSNRPFSSRTVVLSHPSRALLDPEDGILWRIARGGLKPLPLPNGDRPSSWHYTTRGEDRVLVVKAESGTRYMLGDADGQFMPYVPRRGTQPLSFASVKSVVSDPIAPTIKVVSPAGETFRGQVELSSPVVTPALYALSALRPPILQVIGHGMPGRMSFSPVDLDPIALFDPLVAAGRRWWLIALAFLVSSVLAAHVGRRMRRHGASVIRCVAWVLWVVLTGLAGYAAYWIIEPRRSHLPTRRLEPKDTPAPLLVSA